MAKAATFSGDRGINDSATFLEEEPFRARLPSKNLVCPRPEYVQPDSGAHNTAGGSLGIHYHIAGRPMKYGNFEKDLDGGYY